VLSESLFTFLLLLALLASINRRGAAGPLADRAARRIALGRHRAGAFDHAALAGDAAGAGNPSAAARASWRRTAACSLLGFLLAMTPWLVRNQSLPAAPPGSSLAVKAVALGSYPDFMYDRARGILRLSVTGTTRMSRRASATGPGWDARWPWTCAHIPGACCGGM
jgi:hypothetical protein